ncbi:MAG: FAD-binding protein [Chloroflexi bacterium]|nr:FAD-binding protein [Chloroflexota bacterium]
MAPAAHYMMGGVKVNSWGETSVPGLLAAGEAACTGAHGANRLASNSLLETVVFAKRMVERTRVPLKERHEETMDRVEEQRTLPAREVVPTDYPKVGLAALQRLMWEEVGIERSSQGLTNAANTLAAWQLVLPEPADRPSYDLRNAIVTGRLMAEAALVREESRGAHYRSDFPNPSNAWVKHLVYRLHQPESPRA